MPRDTLGRLLLLTAVAMLADLLLPWSVMYGEHLPLARLGPLTLGLAVLIALAGAPLAGKEYRLSTRVAALPLVIGAFGLGLGLTYWLFLARENTQALALVPDGSADTTSGPLISADIGLYLFMLGAGVLTVIGYQLFLAAARAGVAPQAAPQASSPVVGAAPVASATARPAREAEPLPVAAAAQAAPTTSATAATPSPSAETRAGQQSSVILPGSAAWHEAPQVRAHVRPSTLVNGWRRPGAPGR